MITLAVGTTLLTLHPDMLWSDERTWFPVEQKTQRTVTGALVISTGTRKKGRMVTLSGNETTAWMQKSVIDQLQAWASIPGQQMTLTLNGKTMNVVFRHEDAPAMDATPVIPYSDPVDEDWFYVTLKLLEV